MWYALLLKLDEQGCLACYLVVRLSIDLVSILRLQEIESSMLYVIDSSYSQSDGKNH